jgi:crotonobetainyl-CoA:carnitine CoA-transferase CaiB-like acyl-CoA transferase
MPEESAWAKLCRVIEREDLLADERLQDIRGRFQHMPELVAAIDQALSHRSRDEWGEIFDANSIIWGPVLGLHEVASDPQAEALNVFPTVHSDQIGSYRTVAVPMRFTDVDVGPKGPAPMLGQHTREILAEAGHDPEKIQSLVERGAIGELS